jgi:hypothetical protein
VKCYHDGVELPQHAGVPLGPEAGAVRMGVCMTCGVLYVVMHDGRICWYPADGGITPAPTGARLPDSKPEGTTP